MIDFHSHILPGMDDGSKSAEESHEMLLHLKSQGVKKVVATPHFYANAESVSDFIKRRKAAYDKIVPFLEDGYPQIVLGAEVRYYEGISKLSQIEELCIEGSNMLLLEMPSSRWTEYILSELNSISVQGRVALVLAHIERYMSNQRSAVFNDLLRNDVLMQVNASFLTDFFTKRKAIKLFQQEKIHFIGSDCHNMTSRPPEILKAYNAIEHKLGKDFLNDFVDYGNSMLPCNTVSQSQF